MPFYNEGLYFENKVGGCLGVAVEAFLHPAKIEEENELKNAHIDIRNYSICVEISEKENQVREKESMNGFCCLICVNDISSIITNVEDSCTRKSGYPQMETLRRGLIPLPSTSGVSPRGVLGVKWGLLSAQCAHDHIRIYCTKIGRSQMSGERGAKRLRSIFLSF